MLLDDFFDFAGLYTFCANGTALNASAARATKSHGVYVGVKPTLCLVICVTHVIC